MNRLHVRYFLFALVGTFVCSVVVGGLLISLLASLVGAAYIGGWWANLAAAGTVAIMAGRKVASIYEDPRLGRIAGAAAGIWVGLGAALGQFFFGLFVTNVYQGEVRVGLNIVFMAVSFIISLVAATIAGRESAHPPEEEEA